jgi:hypothetical protein
VPGERPGAVSTAEADRLRRVHDQLAVAVTNLTGSTGWRQMLTVAARLPTYSPHNVVLIASQFPAATRVCGYASWRALGRQVRAGERGIAILAPVTVRGRRDRAATAVAQPSAVDRQDSSTDPTTKTVRGFRSVTVFDISQTEGPALPEVRPRLLDGAAPPGLWESLAGQVTAAGFTLIRGDCAPANGVTDHQSRTVTVLAGLAAAQAVKTLAHELAHTRMHGPDRPAGIDRPVAEVEAESVAYLVTTAHGMDPTDYTVPYVAGWSGGQLGIVLATTERVLSTAGEIIAAAPPQAADQLPPPAATTPRRPLARERGLADDRAPSPRRPVPGLEIAR